MKRAKEKKNERCNFHEKQGQQYRFEGMIIVLRNMEEKVMKRHRGRVTEGGPGEETRMIESMQRNHYILMIRKGESLSNTNKKIKKTKGW
jgi:hypothetical protein